MRALLVMAVCALVLFVCSSCNLLTSDNTDDNESYLTGKIKDSEGNTINDASVYILFNDMMADSIKLDFPSQQSINNTKEYTVEISSAYLGHVRTLVSGSGTHHLMWDGLDEDGNPVCNGVYFYHLNAGIYESSKYFMLNDEGLTNRPAVKSTNSGYRLPLKKYFQFGTEIELTNELGEITGYYSINGNFEVVIKKEGYETISRHISLSSYNKGHIENFILSPSK